MRKKIILLIIAAMVIAGLLLIFALQYVMAMPSRHTAEVYLRALATGDVDGAKAVSSGKAAEAAGKLEGKNLAARVDEVSTSVQALGRGWARVKATVELTIADGTADVGWYELDVIKEVGSWKVVSFREDAPDLSGWSLVWGRTGDVAAAKEVFAGYLDALAAGKWDEAVKYLAGPARKSMEASRDMLGKGAVFGKVESLQAKLIWARGKEMMVKFGYKANGRDIVVLADLHRTIQGWRIIGLR